MTTLYHTPVLLTETIAALRVTAGKKYIDATLGGGGHAVEIIKRGGVLLGIDTDKEAIEFSRRNIKYQISKIKKNTEGKDWNIVQANFWDIEKIAIVHGFAEVEGILFDLGVSSHQLDTKERGFSYRYADSVLDLRLRQDGETAAQFVNRASEKELYEIFSTFGEEERAGTIAHAIVRARSITPIALVGDLVNIIESIAIPRPEQPSVLSRIFQALRIAVNDELEALKKGIEGAHRLLVPGGRLAVISFHSLEDRIVKQMMRKEGWLPVNRKPIISTHDEIAINKRARSAKLRVATKI